MSLKYEPASVTTTQRSQGDALTVVRTGPSVGITLGVRAPPPAPRLFLYLLKVFKVVGTS